MTDAGLDMENIKETALLLEKRSFQSYRGDGLTQTSP